MIKKTLIFISILFFLFAPFLKNVGAQEKTEVIFFTSPTCPHCANQKNFLNNIENDNIIITEYDFSQNIEKANQLYEEYNVPKNQQGLIPLTFIGQSFFVGFSDSTGKDIISAIEGLEKNEKSQSIKIPFFGEIDVYSISLPVLAITLGIVDGFNVCSLGALVVILGLVMILRSRKRIFLVGSIFIITTGLVYGLLIFMWHQLFSFISPYIKSMEILIGTLSIIAGAYLLREFIKSLKQGATCNSGGIIAKLNPKVEKIFSTKKNIAVLLGVVAIFAMMVTIIEFPCSAFIPMLFTGILVEAGLSNSSSLLYISLFLLFYMLDEIIIFAIAVLTMRIKIVSPKFINAFNLIAALIFLFLGLFYISKLI